MFNDSYVEQSFKAKPTASFYIEIVFAILLTGVGVLALIFLDLLIGFIVLCIGIGLFIYCMGGSKIEYEYTLTNGSVEVAKILNAKKRKELKGFELSMVDTIIPISSDKYKQLSYSKKYNYTSRMDDSNVICVLVDEAAKKNLYLIEPDEKSMAHIKTYARNKMSDF